MAAYEWKIPGLFKVDPVVAGEVCEQLATSDGGLTPASLVEVARYEGHPLHNEFEWDDSIAAENFREIQAQTIIRNLVVKVVRPSGEHVADRQFLNIPGGKSQYAPIGVVMNRTDFNTKLLKSALNDMQIFKARYRRLAELSDVFAAMDVVLSEPVG